MHRVVPELVVENFHKGRQRGDFSAIGMFLDLSGFSTMTDVLMQHGQHGAEVLAGLMHSVFDPLVESILQYGGKITGFAGDGVMALFPIGSDVRSVALNAVASAYLIQKRFQEYPSRQTLYGTFRVSAKIGLAFGSVAWGILRSPEGDQAAYYFRGSAVDASAEAEHHARPGDVLLHESAWELLPDAIDCVPYGPYQRLIGVHFDLPAPTPIEFPPVDLEVSRRFMPAEVIAYDVRGEFRQNVNLFMRFPDLSEAHLDELLTTVFEMRTRYGGLLSRLDFGDKGCSLLMLWGAPVAYENDISRALNFLLELKSRLSFPITSGVTYYIAHAGYLGSALFEDYTCYGWGVNLAARFMMTAPRGETWVDDRIARLVSSRFDIESVGSQFFKGFASEQKVHRLLRHRDSREPLYQGELVGRRQELAQLERFASPLSENRSAGLMLVVGDAGIGKGRLVHEFRSLWAPGGRRVLWAICQSDQVLRQSFNPLRNWLLDYFGFTPNQTLQERYQLFQRTLDELVGNLPDPALAQELDRTRSVLGALLDLHWADSLYEQLDAEGRYNNTFLALVALLKAESLRQPVVLLLEDLQFTDPDSRELFPRLKRSLLAAGQSYPIAIIVTTRPPALGLAKDLIDARITLRGLTLEETAHLTDLKLGGLPDPDLVRLLNRRSEGNPYFAEQIIRYLQDESLIETSKTGWRLVREIDATFLPGDIRSVLVARLDQLPRGVRESVQTASVLGRRFEIAVLTQMWREDERLQEHIVEAERAAIWSPVDETHYLFSHGLLRDAAYDMQMRARRKELHAQALAALEQLYAGATTRYAELAHHAKYAELGAKAQGYYTLAGKMAAQAYQNSQAVDYYTRALAFLSADDLAMRFEVLADRLELYDRMGKREFQSKDLDALERLARKQGDPDRLPQVLMLRAAYHFAVGEFRQAIDCAQGAEELSTQMTNSELGLFTQLVWSLALLRLGRLDEAMQRCQATLERHRAARNRKEEARALTSLGLIALEQKEPARAETYLVQAVEAAREVNDLPLQGKAFNNLAVLEGSVHGDYVQAQRYYEEAHRVARETGDRQTECITLGNLGFVAGMQGDFPAAHNFHEQALRLSLEVGNRYQEMYTLINLSAVMALQHESRRAIEYAMTAASLARQTSERSAEAWSMLYLGHGHLLQGDLDRAEAAYRSSLQIREQLGQPSLAMEPLAGLVEAYLQKNNLAGAAGETEKILEFLDVGTLDGTDEPLRVYHACYRFLQRTGDARARQIMEYAIGLLEAQVSRMGDETTRRRYIESTPWRQAIWDLARAKEQS